MEHAAWSNSSPESLFFIQYTPGLFLPLLEKQMLYMRKITTKEKQIKLRQGPRPLKLYSCSTPRIPYGQLQAMQKDLDPNLL